jgi:hypothetical protein
LINANPLAGDMTSNHGIQGRGYEMQSKRTVLPLFLWKCPCGFIALNM